MIAALLRNLQIGSFEGRGGRGQTTITPQRSYLVEKLYKTYECGLLKIYERAAGYESDASIDFKIANNIMIVDIGAKMDRKTVETNDRDSRWSLRSKVTARQ
jgi:hypothetical protein